ncbi:MAG: N-acetylmuramoyl-L-alanine amidase [Candidatus Fibromonas sp.]|jgi:N-acetylmuramoyl-L-alanine amidase|nr:N-acetylmuramoyl-L-alanine amidase [Candidatus Fibromonas sp.]
MFKKFLFFFLSAFSASALAQDTIANLQIEKKGGVAYANGIDLGKKLKMQMFWHSEADILQIGASSWVLDNEWASIKDTSFLLQTPVQSHINGKQSFWLPFPSSLPVFERMLNKNLEYDSVSAKIVAVQTKDIWSVNLDAKNNGEVIELKLLKPFTAEGFYVHPNYILRINGAAIDSAMFSDLAKKSVFISRVFSIQDKQSAQLTLVLRDNCEGPELVKKDGGKVLQIVLRKKQAASGQQKTAAPEAKTQAQDANSTGKKIRTIVIDPGHGGKDPGAIGHKSLQEKEVVLAVGLKLKSKLEANGFSVKMTRSTDKFITLEERPKMASDWGGDLFISLHCNAIEGKERQQKTEGFKFYILRAGGSEEDKAIARRENKAVALESGKKNKTDISPAEWIILDNQLALYAERSALLAGHLVEAFDGGSVKKLGTGAGQAGFFVLVGAYMPAVLAELGFITNPTDGAYMATEKGQNELADRLAKAITAFAK